jgi:hypothetical protein
LWLQGSVPIRGQSGAGAGSGVPAAALTRRGRLALKDRLALFCAMLPVLESYALT